MTTDAQHQICCAVCGSLNVQYAVWYRPLTSEVMDEFGSWNAGDNTFCEDCDTEGRDPNADLIYEGTEPVAFKKARAKRARIDAKQAKEATP